MSPSSSRLATTSGLAAFIEGEREKDVQRIFQPPSRSDLYAVFTHGAINYSALLTLARQAWLWRSSFTTGCDLT